MAWGEEFKGIKYISCKQGETIEVEIEKIERVQYDPTKHKYDNTYKKKGGESLGFWDEFTTDKGILKVGAFALAYALKGAGADEGTKVRISHPTKGEYKVEMLNGV